MKKTDQTMANYESIKPIIEKMMLDHDLSMAQLSVKIGKGTSYISNASRFGLTDSAKKQLLLLLQGISKRGIIASDLLKYEMELTSSLKKEILRLENTINRVKQSNVDIGLYASGLERRLVKIKLQDIVIKNLLDTIKKDKWKYRYSIELSFMAGMFLIINFIGFLHAIAVILSGDVGLYDVLLGASNVLGVIFFVCIFEDILIDLED